MYCQVVSMKGNLIVRADAMSGLALYKASAPGFCPGTQNPLAIPRECGSFLEIERSPYDFAKCKWKAVRRGRQSGYSAALGDSRRHWFDRHEIWMWSAAVWGMHHPPGRRCGSFLWCCGVH